MSRQVRTKGGELMAKPLKNSIGTFYHCGNCLEQRPEGVSPREWLRAGFGPTPKGFQLWCVRCEMSIVSFNLLGQKIKIINDEDEGGD